jgi:predicted nucleic acid-binding protein
VTHPQPLFVDTNAFVALFDTDDEHHTAANAVLDGIRDGDPAYGPIFTSRYVLSETATVLLYGVGHREAVDALTTIRASSTFNILDVTKPIFDRTAEQFAQYDDQQISFIDHLNSVFGEQFDIDHIFAFEEDFRTLGMTRVPVDTGDVPTTS